MAANFLLFSFYADFIAETSGGGRDKKSSTCVVYFPFWVFMGPSSVMWKVFCEMDPILQFKSSSSKEKSLQSTIAKDIEFYFHVRMKDMSFT